MIVLYHKNGCRFLEAVDASGNSIDLVSKIPLQALFEIAALYPNEWISWRSIDLKGQIDEDRLTDVLHNDCMMVSDLRIHNPIPYDLHYVEESPFIKVKLDVTYPTWQMSDYVGAAHAQLFAQLAGQIKPTTNLNLALNLIAKQCQSQGLLCYHTPIIRKLDLFIKSQDSTRNLINSYQFISKAFKKKWLFFLLFSHFIFEKRLPLFKFFSALCIATKRIHFDRSKIKLNTTKTCHNSSNIDVIIPTMGRATYLYDVLKDFAVQTVLPEKVIIVEQEAEPRAKSALGYLQKESWPFEIIHKFIHQTGACNARNIALAQTTADWVFFADDDIRFSAAVLEDAIKKSTQFGTKCLALSCLQKGEIDTFKKIHQWSSFPSGASIVEGQLSRKLLFNTAYEHGYGEDADYGMQLRNAGADILYCPDISLLHLKAPVGGFRQKVTQPWESDEMLPKPSPTIMLYRLKHTTTTQQKGYKLRLFLRQLNQKKPLHFIKFIKQSKHAWNSAVNWAQIIDKK